MAQTEREATGWVGWVYFAGILMIVQGLFHAFAGLVGLLTDTVYVAGPNAVWVFDLVTWGWVHLLLGIFVAIAGWAVLNGRVWGRTVGVLLTLLSAVVSFGFIPIYPVWALVILAVDALVLYALVAHGGEARVSS